MTEAAETFLELSRPFRAVYRHDPEHTGRCVVRDRHGYEICVCDDEDAAHAIAECLNSQPTKST